MPVSGFKVSSGMQSKHSLNRQRNRGDLHRAVPVRWPQHHHFGLVFPTDLHTIDLALHKENMDNSTSTGKSGHMRSNTLSTAICVDTIVTMVL